MPEEGLDEVFEIHELGGAWRQTWHDPSRAECLACHTQGDPENRLVAPGSASRSMLLSRLASLGPDRRPPFGSSVPDPEGIALLRAWITNDLPGYWTFAQWQVEHFGSVTDPRALPEADPDEDGASNRQEFVAGTLPLKGADVWGIALERRPDAVRLRFRRAANRAYEIQTATLLAEPGVREPLDMPENRPVFPAAPGETTVLLPATESVSGFFRVQLRAPSTAQTSALHEVWSGRVEWDAQLLGPRSPLAE